MLPTLPETAEVSWVLSPRPAWVVLSTVKAPSLTVEVVLVEAGFTPRPVLPLLPPWIASLLT